MFAFKIFLGSDFYYKIRIMIFTFSKKMVFLAAVFFESLPVVVVGVVKLKHTRILATLSGLKLDAKLENIHSSLTHKHRLKGEVNIGIVFAIHDCTACINTSLSLLLNKRKVLIHFYDPDLAVISPMAMFCCGSHVSKKLNVLLRLE